MAMIRRNVIIILGMHRSGTSLVSGILERLGVEFGSDLLGAMEGVNEKGFWEHRCLVEAHEELLHALGRAWYDITPLPDGWLESSAAQDFKRNMMLWIQEEFSDTSLFGLKDPRMCLFLPLWQQIFKGLNIVVHHLLVLRNPLEVAQSLYKRDGLPPLYSLALARYYLSSIYQSIHDTSFFKVTYRDVVVSTQDTFEQVEKEFSLGFQLDVLKENVGGLLDHSLYHYELDDGLYESLEQLLAKSSHWLDLDGNGVSDDTRLHSYFTQIQEAWEYRHNNTLALQKKLAEIGGSLEHAQQVVAERDAQLKSLTDKLISLGKEHEHAQQVVAERDAQLEHIYAYMDKLWIGRWLMKGVRKSE